MRVGFMPAPPPGQHMGAGGPYNIPAGAPPMAYNSMPMISTDFAGVVDTKQLKRNVASLHVFVVLAVFAPPFMLCMNLAMNMDAAYFNGRWPPLLALFLIPMIIALPAAHIHWPSKMKSTVFLFSIWIPAAIFAGVGGFAKSQAYVTMSALENSDCKSMQEKVHLQRAYEEAKDVIYACEDKGIAIEDCPVERRMSKKVMPELQYLQSLEHRFPCAGFCEDGQRLWDNGHNEAPACKAFASEWIRGAYVQAKIVLLYSGFVLLAMIPVFALMEPLFKDIYNNEWTPYDSALDSALNL